MTHLPVLHNIYLTGLQLFQTFLFVNVVTIQPTYRDIYRCVILSIVTFCQMRHINRNKLTGIWRHVSASCCVVLCRVVLCRVVCYVVLCCVVSCFVVSCRVVSCRVVFATHSLQVFTSLLLYTKLDAVLKILLLKLDRRHPLTYHQIGRPWCKLSNCAFVLSCTYWCTVCV
jgi:hypothetical protein